MKTLGGSLFEYNWFAEQERGLGTMRQIKLYLQQQRKTGLWFILFEAPLWSFFFFFFVGPFVRFLVGLPNNTLSEWGILFYTWVGYTICWEVFAVVGRGKQNFRKYYWWSLLIYYLAIIATFLIPR